MKRSKIWINPWWTRLSSRVPQVKNLIMAIYQTERRLPWCPKRKKQRPSSRQ